jgi:ankyrin repeat protein
VDWSGFPADLIFDTFENLKIEVLPAPQEVPVIPMCDLFQNLNAWKGKRIAVRGEAIGTTEGSWLSGQCKETFKTGGFQWPPVLTFAGPAYYSNRISSLIETDVPAKPSQSEEALRGRFSVVRTATYIGRLRVRNQYRATCRVGGDWITNGFGHLNAATAELIVEAIRDVELTPRPPLSEDDDDANQSCTPPNQTAICAKSATLARAAGSNCMKQVVELLSKNGIDAKDGSESAALDAAISGGFEAIARLLIDNGAPVNPTKHRGSAPLEQAAWSRRRGIMRMLLKAGADVEVKDGNGFSYLPRFGYFNTAVSKILLEAGANPNAMDGQGQTALMGAAGYGYEDAVELLIKYRAEVNLKDRAGRTALMHAAAGKYVDAIPLLLASGAALFARDADGQTALDIARESRNAVAVELLSKAMSGAR